MPSASFTGLDTKDDINCSADASIIVEKDRTIRIGRPGPFFGRRDAYVAIDCNSEPLLRSGVTITDAKLEFTFFRDGSGFSDCDFEVREMDPENTFNDWYRDGTHLAHQSARWRGAHHIDVEFSLEMRDDGVVVDNAGIAEVPWEPGELYLKRFPPGAGQIVGLHDQIGSYFKTPPFPITPAGQRIRNITMRLKRVGAVGVWAGETLRVQVFSAKAGGGGKYDFEPDELIVNSPPVDVDTLSTSFSDVVFAFTIIPSNELDENTSYTFKLTGSWTPDNARYVVAEGFGSADGDNEIIQGSDCALLLYGEEQRMNTQNYIDGLNLEDVAISSPLVIHRTPAPRFIPAGGTTDGTTGGGSNGQLAALLQRAIDRPGWDSNKRFGLHFSAENTGDTLAIPPAWQGEGGGFAVPTLQVTWTDYELPTFDNLPPFPPDTLVLGATLSFTVLASSLTGLDLVFSIVDPPDGSAGPATIDPSSGLLEWTPFALSEISGGPALFQIVVTDEVGGTDEAEFLVTVIAAAGPLPVDPIPIVDSPAQNQGGLLAAGTGSQGLVSAGSGSGSIGPAASASQGLEEAVS